MIEQIKAHKVLVGVAIVGFLAIAWFMMSSGGAPQSAQLLQTSSVSASLLGNATVAGVDQELQTTLTQVRAIQLNSQILSDPSFLSLNDIGQQIVPESYGRPNPFAPISAATH